MTREGVVRNPVAAPDGSRVVFALDDPALDDPGMGDDAELAVVPMAGGALRLLTRNQLRDSEPRFTADGAHVVFRSRVELPKTSWVITVPRVVAVE